MLKWLTGWGWFCFAGGWRRVASRHRWSETKMIKMVWCVGWGVSFGVCWVWGVVLLFLFLFLLMDLMDVDLWLILADFVSRFHADVFGLCRADCWHGPWYYLKLPMDLTRLNIGCHWLSLIVIDCHVSFAHICPYLSLFIPVHPCSNLRFSLFSEGAAGRRCVDFSARRRSTTDRPTVSLRCEVGAQDGRQARRQIPVGALDTEKVAENISRTYREIEKWGRSRRMADRDRFSLIEIDRDRSTFALCNALKPLTRLEMPHRWMKCCYNREMDSEPTWSFHFCCDQWWSVRYVVWFPIWPEVQSSKNSWNFKR